VKLKNLICVHAKNEPQPEAITGTLSDLKPNISSAKVLVKKTSLNMSRKKPNLAERKI
jgi:hypothetical protein